MLRAALSVVFALMLVSCANQRSSNPSHPVAAAAAHFIVQAIGLTESGDEYRWQTFEARVADGVRWRAPSSTLADGAVRRDGVLMGSGINIVATGDATYVTALSIDTDAVNGVAVLEALQQAGSEVSFQGDFETYSEYVVTPRGRDTAVVAAKSICSPFDPHPEEPCRNYVTLTLNPW